MIQIHEVSKVFRKKQVLDKVTFSVEKGEVFGLIGPNGAGKSTLLSILAGITKPSSGSILIGGANPFTEHKRVRSFVGYVPQDIGLWEDLTVEDNLRLWSKFSSKRIDKNRLYALCQNVRLEDKWKEKVANLSGGMKRKLNIAVSLIHDPEILLMDEPTVGIDIESKLEINQYIKELARSGKTVIYSTHDANEIFHLCDRIGALNQGTLQFLGTIKEAMERMEKEEGIRSISNEELLLFLLGQKRR